MDWLGILIIVLELPILVVKGFDQEWTFGLNVLLPQYLPSIYQWLLNLPVPLVPWPYSTG